MAKGTAKTDRLRTGGGGGSGAARVPRLTPVRIRAAVDGDTAALARLRAQAERAHAELLPDYFRMTDRAPAMVVPVGAGASVVLLAEVPQERPRRAEGRPPPTVAVRPAPSGVVGYVSVSVVETPSDRTMTPRRRAYVDVVVVDEGHRGVGIGTELMRAAADWARRREAAELVLTVWNQNAAAEALYRRLGYQPIARILRHVLDR